MAGLLILYRSCVLYTILVYMAYIKTEQKTAYKWGNSKINISMKRGNQYTDFDSKWGKTS